MARRSLPSLNALRCLEAFARHGRMTLAADELFVTHGAVSRQIRQLETALGVPLVEGPRNRPRLTLAAAQLSASVTQALDIIEKAVPRADDGRQTTLRLSCIGTFAMKWLIPRLPDFIRRFPDVDLRISESYDAPDFGPQGVDGAIRIQNMPYDVSMMATPFLPNHVGPVLAVDLEADGPQDLLDLPRLKTKTRVQAWAEWATLSGVTLPKARSEHLFEHNSSMLEAAMAGLGVAITPWANVAIAVEAGRLRAPMGFLCKSGDHVLLRPSGRPNAAVDDLATWLIEQGVASPTPPQGAF